MRISKLTIIALVVMLLGCDTGNRVDPFFEDYFIKYYGEDGNQEGADIYVNDDDSMILLGNSSSLTEKSKPFIVKTDPQGNILWQRQMGERDEVAVDVELITQGTHQGKLVVISNVETSTSSRIRVTIIDQTGHGVDSVVVNSAVWQKAKAVTIASNDDFLITGSIAPDPNKNAKLPNPADDTADVLCMHVSQALQTDPTTWAWLGGQYKGSGDKVFEVMSGNTLNYAIFGWSDYPDASAVYENKFEVSVVEEGGDPASFGSKSNGIKGEEQICSQVIRVPAAQEDGFFMVGTSTSGSNSNIYITKFSKDLTAAKKLDQKLLYGQKLEGVAAAAAVQDEGYFVLANEIQDNNNSNIFLVHIRFDGSEVWNSTFGTDDGDDKAGAVAALKDGRVAVLGTMDLETQKKMALIIVTPKGGFSN
ncbi:hypothetical protein [Chryseolinea soli]|uniref:Uncharacterized protein n=1 Tax=Chryseolinea soli TaxID=2321403 RepID=A0A385ST27_9BACT|nr:hypothetical protein [Chryseolinea soli]AYB33297.1 hypothetical protein D4L85_23115 [Chryseolinea soli]